MRDTPPSSWRSILTSTTSASASTAFHSQVARRLHALYDQLGEVAADGERDRLDLERRLLAEAVHDAFPNPEERRIVGQADRLGLGSGH